MTLRTAKVSWQWMAALTLVPFLGGMQQCEPAGDPTGKPDTGCACPLVWEPVCGTDGVTYSNSCAAYCAGEMVAEEGECRSDEPRTCLDDGECLDGERCNHDECHSSCSGAEDTACPAVCYGACEPAPPPRDCTDDTQCGPDEYCSAGDCPVCHAGEPCPAVACVGRCQPLEEPGCASDSDCAPGYVCEYDAGEPCREGEVCAKLAAPAYGYCVQQQEPSRCLSDDECGADSFCNQDLCYGAPGSDGEDRAGLAVCYGVCEPRRECDKAYCPESDYCEYGQAPDANGCPTCECNRPPPECAALACDVYCEYGQAPDANGCPTCECNEPPPVCAALACDVHCEYGHVADDHGCDTCACNEPPPACDAVMCDLYCEYGFQTDDHGCDTCACNEPPPACDAVTCDMACEKFQTDESGCPICTCAEPG